MSRRWSRARRRVKLPRIYFQILFPRCVVTLIRAILPVLLLSPFAWYFCM